MLEPKLTEIGRAAIANANANGFNIVVDEIAIGTSSYLPSGSETSLQSECGREPVLAGNLMGDGHVRVVQRFNNIEGVNAIYEFGVYCEGVLLAVWSNTAPLVRQHGSFSVELENLSAGTPSDGIYEIECINALDPPIFAVFNPSNLSIGNATAGVLFTSSDLSFLIPAGVYQTGTKFQIKAWANTPLFEFGSLDSVQLNLDIIVSDLASPPNSIIISPSVTINTFEAEIEALTERIIALEDELIITRNNLSAIEQNIVDIYAEIDERIEFLVQQDNELIESISEVSEQVGGVLNNLELYKIQINKEQQVFAKVLIGLEKTGVILSKGLFNIKKFLCGGS